MHIVLDILVVGIVVGSIILGWRRGFVKSISGLISLLLAVVIVSSFAQPVAEKLDDTVVRPWAVKQVVKTQEGLTLDASVDQMDLAVINQGISDKFGVDILGVEDSMGAATVGEYIDGMLRRIGVTVTVSMALATIGLFALAWLGTLLIGLLLKPILKLPILRQCNGILGVVVGLVSASLILMVLACVVELGGKTDPMFGAQTVEKTYIFKHITEINPLVNWITK
ncbi:MAG: CvpA family protein [Clostridia bacterium]|nr:CvpA family protein [Clostridia bacterium]